MDQLQITCPHCGFSKNVPRSSVPDRATRVNCPECKGAFPLQARTGSEATPLGDKAPAQSAEPVVPGVPAATGQPEQPVAVSEPVSAEEPRYLPLLFTGSAREYFGIWIVNTLLKIVTLGIYSPWAKVRKRKFFYGNTRLEEANFDYLANPLTLLKGWLIGAACFIAYSLGSQFSPVIAGIFGLVFFLLMPLLIVRSRIYNNRNSAHRNVRFNFRPAYGESYKVFALLPLLLVPTLGLISPYVFYRQKRFMMENNSFGQSEFGFDARVKDYYILSLKVVGVAILCFGSFFSFSTTFAAGISTGGLAMANMIALIVPLLMIGGYFFLMVYSYVRVANLTWNSTHLGRNRFISSLRVRGMSWIMLTNLIASVLSFGLLIPWASVRLARYRFDNLTLETYGDLDHFLNAKCEPTSAIGEEICDIFDVDFGF